MTHERFQNAWGPRARALTNVPLVLRMAWDSGPGVATAGMACRVAGALMPVAMLWVAKGILDAVQVHFTAGSLRPDFWWLVSLECGLAILSTVVGRAAGFFDALLADRFARHVSVRVMEHAARLDLATHESPAFHDMLDRARAQATDRIVMVHALGSIAQQAVTVFSLAISIAVFSPWLLLLMVVAVVPAFVGESHFAFLGYSLNIEQTPTRRRLDYLRHARREPRVGEGAQAVRAGPVRDQRVRPPLGRGVRAERGARARAGSSPGCYCRRSAPAATTAPTPT